MKSLGFLCLFFLLETAAFVRLGYFNSNPGMVSIGSSAMELDVKGRKLKDNVYPPSSNQEDAGHVILEDYRPITPVPRSKASIRSKPIQHGTPLMPYIPKPSPPPGKPRGG